MSQSQPIIPARVTFLTTEQGGRRSAVDLRCGYMPHIVVRAPAILEATLDAVDAENEDYLGVEFVDGPANYVLGNTVEANLRLMYHPRVDYGALIPGATFSIREGGRIVGDGEVLSRD